MTHCKNTAYIVGVALGDGNLSCPNGKATRLRITCDIRYKSVIKDISSSLETLFPQNKISLVNRKDNCCDISIYSNKLKDFIPWNVNEGSKFEQNAHVPNWVFEHKQYIKSCLKGLLQTDGSLYFDRSYPMINFTNTIQPLAEDVFNLMQILHYSPRMYVTMQKSGKPKYTVRLSRGVEKFIHEIDFSK